MPHLRPADICESFVRRSDLLVAGQGISSMKWHIVYWWARLRNDFLRLCWFGPTEAQYVQEVMAGLRKTDKGLSALLDEYESRGEDL